MGVVLSQAVVQWKHVAGMQHTWALLYVSLYHDNELEIASDATSHEYMNHESHFIQLTFKARKLSDDTCDHIDGSVESISSVVVKIGISMENGAYIMSFGTTRAAFAYE